MAKAKNKPARKAKPAAKPRASRAGELNAAQKVFCEHYLAMGRIHGARAYMLAYPRSSAKAAEAAASRLLSHVNVRAYIDARVPQIVEETGVTPEWVVKEMAKLARMSPKQLYREDGTLKTMAELTDDQSALLAGMDVEEMFEFGETEKDLEAQPHGGALRRKDRPKVLVGHVRKVKWIRRDDILDKIAGVLGMKRTTVTNQTPKEASDTLRDLLDAVAGSETGVGPSRDRAGAQ